MDDVVGIMRGNVEKVLDRDQKLGDLEDRSGTKASSRTLYCNEEGRWAKGARGEWFGSG